MAVRVGAVVLQVILELGRRDDGVLSCELPGLERTTRVRLFLEIVMTLRYNIGNLGLNARHMTSTLI